MPETADLENGFLKSPVKKWEVFPGRNKFYCDGRIMLATQAGIFYFTLFLIIATSACFFGMDAEETWKISPILPILAGVQCIFVVTVLCRTACGDPGILPRASPAEAEALDRQLEKEQHESEQAKGSSLPMRPPPRVRDVVIGGRTFKLKYCYTCKIFRPPRASHCSICDNCVDRFDHHCPWVGNCVGSRNYKYFYLFLSSLTVYCAYLMALSVTSIVMRSKSTSFQEALSTRPLSPVVALVAFFSIWSVAGLAGFHSYLTGKNMTTNEDIKGTFKDRDGNPFSRGGCLTNCAAVLCGPVPPSLIDRRGWVTKEDVPTSPPNQHTGFSRTSYGTQSNAPPVISPTNGTNGVSIVTAATDSLEKQRLTSVSAEARLSQMDESDSLTNRPSPTDVSYQPPYRRSLPPIDHPPVSAVSTSKEYLT